ncbi:hypothetical protein [Sorangium sp. So ce131]|uniref:hypothetical protein n=1 Tax=Sorangium sp. So ce131 TaxID=3133282 RepID=UPI003F61B61B
MITLSVTINKGPIGPNNPAQGYIASVLPISGPPGVSVDTTLAYPTQQQAIDELTKKLRINFQEGDTIMFAGYEYATVDDAMNAIVAAAPTWK